MIREEYGIKTHKDLTVWREALNLAKEVYQLTSGFPKEEIYGLTSQMRRAAVSVPSNTCPVKLLPERC